MKKDYVYLRSLSWDELKRWAKYAGNDEIDWRDLARSLIEKGEEQLEDAYDKGRGEGHNGYHHWDSN